VRHLIVAGGKRVADRGPVRAFGDGHFHAVLLEETFLGADHEWGIIRQRDDAAAELGGFRGVAGVGRAEPAFGQTGEQGGEDRALGRFAEELGWSLSPPMTFSLDTYIADLERAEAAYRSQFGAFAVLTRDRWTLMERFFETVVAKSREIFSAAERDTEAWVKSLLPPIELQVREQRAQLKKRAESISKIRDAQGSLDERISELELALEDTQARLAALRRFADRVHEVGARVPDDLGMAEVPLAA